MLKGRSTSGRSNGATAHEPEDYDSVQLPNVMTHFLSFPNVITHFLSFHHSTSQYNVFCILYLKAHTLKLDFFFYLS